LTNEREGQGGERFEKLLQRGSLGLKMALGWWPVEAGRVPSRGRSRFGSPFWGEGGRKGTGAMRDWKGEH